MKRVTPRKRIGLCIRPKQRQKRAHKQKQRSGKHDPDEKGRISHKRRRVLRAFFFFLSHRYGCHCASAHAKHIGECHKKNKDRVGQADRRHLKRIIRLPHKERIRHVINNRHQAADHTRDRHLCHRF